MATALPFGVLIPQDSRSSVWDARLAVDERVLQLLDDHRPWELLDDTVLAIIDQTYAALLEILGLVAPPPPEGGGPVKVTQLVYYTDPDSPAVPPMSCVVAFEASARHCYISLNTGLHSVNKWCEFPNFICQMNMMPTRRRRQECRARVRSWPGTIQLARADGDVRCRPDVSVEKGFLAVMHIPPGVSVGKGLPGVLDTVRSRLNTAIEAGTGIIRMARKSWCRSHESHDKLKDMFRVHRVLEKMRREIDIGLILRSRAYERHHRAQEIGRRRLAVEMDVDRMDMGEEEEVLAKRLKAMQQLWLIIPRRE